MFGYSINMSTHVDEEETNIKVDFNTNPENITSIEFRYFNQLDLDTSIFRVDGDYFKVWCPSSSLITKHYGIDQKCFAGEYPMKIDGKYTVSYIGEGKISETQNIIDFYNSTFILNNYIDTPQAFLCAGFSGEASSPAWKIVTIVFIVISSLALIEIIAVIVCCNIKV